MVWYGMNKTNKIRCKKCKQEMGGFDYNWNGGLCNSCKTRRGVNFGIIFLLVTFVVSVPLAIIEFNYGIDRCSNLKTTESNYGFTNTIEINAQFNKHCYFLKNHPLAFPNYFLIAIMASIFLGLLGFAIGQMTKPSGFKKVDYS